jgi:hypothetical protein
MTLLPFVATVWSDFRQLVDYGRDLIDLPTCCLLLLQLQSA